MRGRFGVATVLFEVALIDFEDVFVAVLDGSLGVETLSFFAAGVRRLGVIVAGATDAADAAVAVAAFAGGLLALSASSLSSASSSSGSCFAFFLALADAFLAELVLVERLTAAFDALRPRAAAASASAAMTAALFAGAGASFILSAHSRALRRCSSSDGFSAVRGFLSFAADFVGLSFLLSGILFPQFLVLLNNLIKHRHTSANAIALFGILKFICCMATRIVYLLYAGYVYIGSYSFLFAIYW